MTKVASLISQIKGKLPKSLQTRVTNLENLEKDLQKAKELKDSDPSAANVEAFNEIDGLTTELSDSIAAQLEAIIIEENKTPPTDPITPVTPAEPITPTTEPIVPPTEPIVPPTEPVTPPAEPVEKKKSQTGWWIAAAVVIAVVTAGAVILKPRE